MAKGCAEMTIEIFMLLVCVPLGLAAICGVTQGMLTVKLKGETLRAALLGLIPAICTLVTFYALLRVLSGHGWNTMEWSVYLIWAAAALVGTLLGWLMGKKIKI